MSSSPMHRQLHLLFATFEPCPTFRPDVAALFGKFLPRRGVAPEDAPEGAVKADGEGRWAGGEALLVSSRGARPGKYLANTAHYVRALFGADRRRYQAIQVR